MVKPALIVFGLTLLLIASVLTWAALQPPAPRPKVSVTFSGYTNDSKGARLAAFTVRNASLSPVLRLSHYRVQVPTSKRWTNFAEGWFSAGTSVLPAGGSETITIVAPTNQPSWRPSISVTPDVGRTRDALNGVSVAARSLGLPMRYRKMTYGECSDWISE